VTAVSVFVDDAIRGDLPMVCAKTGQPAELIIRMRQPVGGGLPAAAWLLLLLGPPGIVMLVVLAVAWPGAEQLTVRVPETQASFERERQMERWRLAALAGGVGFPVLAAFGLGMFPHLWLLLTVASFLAAGALTWTLWRQSITVSIDVTRRWVTFTNVHPAFAAAVNRQGAQGPLRS
jgi:hypothetical protein